MQSDEKSRYYEICFKTLPMGDCMSHFIGSYNTYSIDYHVLQPSGHGEMGGLLSSKVVVEVLVLADVCKGRSA